MQKKRKSQVVVNPINRFVAVEHLINVTSRVDDNHYSTVLGGLYL